MNDPDPREVAEERFPAQETSGVPGDDVGFVLVTLAQKPAVDDNHAALSDGVALPIQSRVLADDRAVGDLAIVVEDGLEEPRARRC